MRRQRECRPFLFLECVISAMNKYLAECGALVHALWGPRLPSHFLPELSAKNLLIASEKALSGLTQRCCLFKPRLPFELHADVTAVRIHVQGDGTGSFACGMHQSWGSGGSILTPKSSHAHSNGPIHLHVLTLTAVDVFPPWRGSQEGMADRRGTPGPLMRGASGWTDPSGSPLLARLFPSNSMPPAICLSYEC